MIMIIQRIKERLFNHKAIIEDSPYTSDPYIQSTIHVLLQNAIDCRCGGMNVPIATVGNQYRCLRCDNTIKNKSYNLGSRDANYTPACPKPPESILNMQYYDAAIELLKKVK